MRTLTAGFFLAAIFAAPQNPAAGEFEQYWREEGLAPVPCGWTNSCPSENAAGSAPRGIVALSLPPPGQTFEELVAVNVKLLKRRGGLGVRLLENGHVDLSDELFDELAAVHGFVNSVVRWESDEKLFGTPEFWSRPVLRDGAWRGDCDEFMNAYALVLEALDWPAAALRPAVCFAPEKSGGPAGREAFNHALLAVPVSVRDLGYRDIVFLDNTKKEPVFFSDASREGYRNCRILFPDLTWRRIGPTHPRP